MFHVFLNSGMSYLLDLFSFGRSWVGAIIVGNIEPNLVYLIYIHISDGWSEYLMNWKLEKTTVPYELDA